MRQKGGYNRMMQIKGPFFSVVIPTLNEEKYLPKLLKDLTGQIDKDFEVIVVDGKSKDRTVEKAESFKGKLPSLEILLSDVRNAGTQRNTGAKKAGGKYMVFIDADSRIPINFLSQIHHYLLEEDPGCRFLTTWLKADSESKYDKTLVTFVNMLLEIGKSLDTPAVMGFDMIIRKQSFTTVGGFDERIRFAEDLDLTKRLAKIGVTWKLLKSPKMVMSLRRLRREGTLESVRKSIVGVSKFLLEGPIIGEIFDYPMGGNVKPSKKKTGRNLRKTLDKYVRVLNQI